jgi:hypothetical protein
VNKTGCTLKGSTFRKPHKLHENIIVHDVPPQSPVLEFLCLQVFLHSIISWQAAFLSFADTGLPTPPENDRNKMHTISNTDKDRISQK